MARLLGRMWDRARGKLRVLSICDKVFEELADKNTKLLDVSSLHIATLMVYNSINRKLVGPHKDSPRLWVVTEKMEHYRAEKTDGIPQEEFRKLIMEWVSNYLLLDLADKTRSALIIAPALAVTAKNAGRKVPRMRDAVEKVPTLLLFTVFSAVGIMLL